ncbi:MAG: stage II sporulation protein D [Clostridiales bacterium]|nr:stage II sporulation protein D [Clostridiales bacterium]
MKTVKRRRAGRRSAACGASRMLAASLAALALGIFLGARLAGAKLKREVSLPLLPLVPAASPIPSAPTSGTAPLPSWDAFSFENEEGARSSQEAPDPSGAAYSCTVPLDSPALTVSVGGEPEEMTLEEYLFGVVAAEMSADSEFEALKAQAVAARTFTALHMAGSAVCRSGCTVCSDHRCCQAYMTEAELRAAWGSSYEKYAEKIRAAVKETEGLVAVYDGKLISALYHASSGPMTENSEAVFAIAKPYLISVDSREGGNETTTVKEFPMAELVDRLNEAFPLAELSCPMGKSDLDIWGRSESGRVNLMRVGNTVVSGNLLRQALGLRSTAFTVEIGESTVIFTCTGYGHGVGMSQLGANEMAKSGASFREILAHFYTGTELAKLTYENGG